MPTVSLDALNHGSDAGFVDAIGPMVEHAPWVAERVAAGRPFASLAALHAAMRDTISGAGRDAQLALLRGHPELAGLAARSGSMTAESVSEQGGAGLDALTAERARIFDELNAAYRAKHGIPFIVAVRRHGQDSILSEFRRRTEQPPDQEVESALAEVFRIVALRLDAAIDAPDRLPVTGRLSTHVLDTANGVPAAGVAVELWELPDGPPRRIAGAITNGGGRTDEPLVSGRPLPVATYELRFRLGDYFRARGMALGSPAFLDVVPLRFGVAEPEGHYHVPLVGTPWSFSTYRGS